VSGAEPLHTTKTPTHRNPDPNQAPARTRERESLSVGVGGKLGGGVEGGGNEAISLKPNLNSWLKRKAARWQ